jgi:hypothetical protein
MRQAKLSVVPMGVYIMNRFQAMPIIDVIDADTFQVKQAVVEKGVNSWSLPVNTLGAPCMKFCIPVVFRPTLSSQGP